MTMNERVKKRNISIKGFGFSCGILAAIFAASVYVLNCMSPSRYVWASRAVNTKDLIGKSRNYVDDILGVPGDPAGYFAGWDHVYLLRPDASYMDNEWLAIKMNENDVITDAAILAD